MSVGVFFLILLGLVVAVLVVMFLFGRRMQKKQDEMQVQIDATSQQISMFIIDKKKIKLTEAGLPQTIVDQTPWIARRSKVPVLKVKAGPQVMNLICDNAIFNDVPVKKEVKATVSGIYVTAVKGMHGKQVATEPKKKSWIERLQEKAGARPVK